MRPRAVLFDLDGTLVDSLDDIGRSMNFVLESKGFPPHPLSDYRAFVGDGITMLARRALPPSASAETLEDCVAAMRRRYGEHAQERTRPYDGIPELLDGIAARGLRAAVLSNKPHDLTVAMVRRLLARWCFDPVFGERDGIPRKPDPSAAQQVACLLGLDPSAILYVGDTPTDFETARAAGMPFAAATWGFRSEDELVRAGAATVVRRPEDVLRLL
jgi:phosphoglycolate phosphatase